MIDSVNSTVETVVSGSTGRNRVYVYTASYDEGRSEGNTPGHRIQVAGGGMGGRIL